MASAASTQTCFWPQSRLQALSQARSLRRFALGCILALAGVLFSTAATPLIAQDDLADAESAKVTVRYDEEAILDHFAASSGEVGEDGRVTLTYLFSTKDSNLLADWSPDISKTKRRIRWSQGYEGTWTTVEDGLIIADQGTFIHKATWDGDVDLAVDYLSMSASGKKDVLAAIYTWDRGKKVVGSQYGDQCIQLTRNLTVRGRPIPAAPLSRSSAEDRRTFGVRMRDGVVSALRNGTVIASSQGEDKFAKNVGPGQVGLAWRGLINGFVFKIEVEGKLSKEYLAKIPGAVTEVGAETAKAD